MNPEKQHAKLLKLQTKGEKCQSREEALKVLNKAKKAEKKLAS